MSGEKNLKGIKGLLRFYNVTLYLILTSLILQIISLIIRPNFNLILVIITLWLCIMSIVAVKKLARTAIIWNKALIVAMCINSIVKWFELKSQYNAKMIINEHQYNNLALFLTIVSVSFYLFYFVYWHRSVRIKNTFVTSF